MRPRTIYIEESLCLGKPDSDDYEEDVKCSITANVNLGDIEDIEVVRLDTKVDVTDKADCDGDVRRRLDNALREWEADE